MDVENLLQNIFNPRYLKGNLSTDDYSKPSDTQIIQQLFFKNQNEPSFNRTLITPSIQDYKTNKNIKNFLKNIKFKYKYDSEVLAILPKYFEQSFEPNETLIALLFFQLFACIQTEEKIEESDFSTFLKLINTILFTRYKSNYITFFFKILMDVYLKQSSNEWTIQSIKETNSFFITNTTLTSEFLQIFLEFSKQSIDKSANTDFDANFNALTILTFFLHEKRPIMENVGKIKHNYRKIFQIIDKPLQELNQDALSVIIELSFYEKNDDNSLSFDEEIQSIPRLFAAKMHSVKINFDYEKVKIHDCPATIDKTTENQLLSQKINNDEDVFNGIIDAPPEILIQQNKELNNALNELFGISELFQYFIENVNTTYYSYILGNTMSTLTQKAANRTFNAYTSLLMILKAIKDKDTFDQYLKQIFDDVLFDPETTIYGPYSLSPQINFIRSEVIQIMLDKSPTSLFILLNTYQHCPFLFAEIIGRYYYMIPVEYLVKTEYFNIISQVGKILRAIKAPRNARSAIIDIFVLYLRDSKSALSCLSSPDFVQCFFENIFEKSLTKICLFSILANTLIKLQNINTIQPMRDFLLDASSNNSICCDIFAFVTKISASRSTYVKLFEPFLEKMITHLDKFSNELNAKTTFSFLLLVSQFTLQYYDFSKLTIFPVLAKNVKYVHVSYLLNLIASGHNINQNSLFLFKRPFFLPLLFVKSPGNFDDTIKFLLKLAEFSEYNCRALHDGKIDLLLLHIIAEINFFDINEFQIDLSQFIKHRKSHQHDIERLLKLICLSKSNGEVASLFTKIITNSINQNKRNSINENSNQNDKLLSNKQLEISNSTINILSSLLLHLSNEPKVQFPIGNVNEICTVEGFKSNFNPEFTFQFKLRIDNGFFTQTKSIVSLFTIAGKFTKLSISLVNGSLYAIYLNKNQQTMVTLSSKVNSNNWFTFTILFNKNQTEPGYRIVTYRNFERLHDSDFTDIIFDKGPIILTIGGYRNLKGPLTFTNEVCGRVSNILMYNRILNRTEMINLLSNPTKVPSDFFFSTMHSDGAFVPLSSSQQKFQIMAIDQLTVSLTKNSVDIEALDNLITHFSYNFIISFLLNNSNEYLLNISSLLSFALKRTTNEFLSTYFASILLHFPEKISFDLFKILELTISQIDQTQIRFDWLEDVIFNFSLYYKTPSFHSIVHHLSNRIRQYTRFLRTKFYFSYFLNSFNKILTLSDDNTCPNDLLDDFITFLSRVSRIHFSLEDCELLMLYVFKSKHQLVYLHLIQNMSESLLQIGYPIDNQLISLLNKSTSMEIIVQIIFALSLVTKEKFHSMVPFLISKIKDKEMILNELEKYVNQSIYLFSLTSALALALKKDVLLSIPRFPLTSLEYHKEKSFLWFVFPLVYAIQPKTHEKTRNGIFNYISSRCVYCSNSKNVDCVLLFLAYLSAFTETSESVLNKMLTQMNKKSIAIDCTHFTSPETANCMFSIFFNTAWPIFYQFNDNRYSYLKNNMIPDFEADFENRIRKNIRKISIGSIDDLMDLLQSFSFNMYCHPQIEETMLVVYAKTICDLFLTRINYKLPQNEIQKLTSNDLKQFLDYFKTEFEKRTSLNNQSYEQFELINSIFGWMRSLLKVKFNDIIRILSTEFAFSKVNEAKQIDISFLNDFCLFEHKRLSQLLQKNANQLDLYQNLKKQKNNMTIQRLDFPSFFKQSFPSPIKHSSPIKVSNPPILPSFDDSNIRIDQQELNLNLNVMESQPDFMVKLIYSSVLKSSKSTNTFSIVFNTGVILFFSIQFDQNGNAKLNAISKNYLTTTNNYHWRFASFDSGILSYNGSDLITYTTHGQNEQENVYLDRPLFSNILFLRTPSIISKSLIAKTQQNYLQSYQDICFIKHTVYCLAMNDQHQIFVVGCDDYKVRIRNLNTGEKIATLSLDNEIPLHLLITDKCSLIVVKTKSYLFVFTITGDLLHKQNMPMKIGKWSTFVTKDELEFVVMEDLDNHNLHYFELIRNNPNDRRVLSVIKSDILVIHFDRNNDCFIIVTKDNKISILPRL